MKTKPKKNIGTADRIVRIVIAIVLFVIALVILIPVFFKIVVILFGLLCLYEAIISWSAIYHVAGKNTHAAKD